jgi:hypothetical protein
MSMISSVFCYCLTSDRPSHDHKLGHLKLEHMSNNLHLHSVDRDSSSSSTLARDALSVGLSHPLQLILLLDRVAVAAPLRGIYQLFSQTLSNALDISEGGFAGTDREEGDGLVDAAEGRHVDGLTADGAS